MDGEPRFYGLYRGICLNADDPEGSSRITLQVPQVLGTQATDWAWPVRSPITEHDHPDHKPHLAAEVAAMLNASSAGDPAHTHDITAAGGELDHEHDPAPGVPATPEHSPHVRVPKAGDGVWVMFEAGDPDLPVWLGIF